MRYRKNKLLSRFFIFLILIQLSVASLLEAQVRDEVERSFSLRYGYNKETNSNHAPGLFLMDTLMLYDWTLEKSTEWLHKKVERSSLSGNSEYVVKTYLRDLLLLPLWLRGSIRYALTVQFIYHEYGHGQHSTAEGFEAFYSIGANRNWYYNSARQRLSATLSNAGMNSWEADHYAWHQFRGKFYYNFFSYYEALVKKGEYSGENYVRRDKSAYFKLPENNRVIGAMIGVNNQMYLTELIEERAYRHGVSFLYGMNYYLGKLSSKNYFKGQDQTFDADPREADMHAVLSYYNRKRDYRRPRLEDLINKPYGFFDFSRLKTTDDIAQKYSNLTLITPQALLSNMVANEYFGYKNYQIERSDIERGNLNALYFSATTYTILYSYYRYLFYGDLTVQTPSPGGFRLPDLNFYHSRLGISYKVTTGYRRKRWRFPLAVEYVFKGQATTELSAGLGYDWDEYAVQLVMLLGRSGGAALELERKFDHKFLNYKIGGRLKYHSMNSLEGERQIPRSGAGNHHYLETDFYLTLLY